MRKMKGVLDVGAVIIVLLIVAVLGGFVAIPGLNLGAITGGQPLAGAAVSSCPDTKATNVDVRVKNILNSSEDYAVGNPTVRAFRAGTGFEQTSGAATPNGAYATLTVDCGPSYDLYVMPVNGVAGAGVNSVSLKGVETLPLGSTGRSVQKNIIAYQSGYPECKVTDSNYANLTSSTGAAQSNGFSPCGAGTSFAVTDAQAFGLGTRVTYHLQFVTNSSGAYGAYGSNDPALPVYLCVDASPAAYSIQNGVTIAGLTALASVPDGGPKNDGFDKCWVIPAIVSTDPIRDYVVSVYADLANPGSSDDVTFRLYDSQYFIGANGSPKIGTVDDTSSDVGLANVGVQVSVS